MKQFDGDVLRSILLLLNDRPELADTLRRITEWEREHYKDERARAPASAKTLFLLCIEKLPGSGYILGSRMSKAGLSDYLIDAKPRFLLIYEIDKLPAKDLAPLLSLCETGRVVETLYGRRREVTLETIVFAAANRVSGIPRELLSRFEFLEFSEYTRDQFIEVSSRLLQRDEGAIGEVAVYIAETVWDVLGVKDVSEAVRIARLAKTEKEVDDHVSVIRKYLPKRRARAPLRA